MQHDKEAGLLHLSEEELKVLGEKRTPIDHRLAPTLLDNAHRLSTGSVDALQSVYLALPHGRSGASAHIEALRNRTALLEQLTQELIDATIEIETVTALRSR